MAGALGTLNYGKSYLRAAEHLCESISTGVLNLPFHDPASLLLGHALELILKACLLQKGATSQQAWGHDLVKLRSTAINSGCELALDQTEDGHFNLLNDAFGVSPYTTRYLETGPATVHDDTIVLKFAKRFAEEASSIIPNASL